jgi:hypothetical protein
MLRRCKPFVKRIADSLSWNLKVLIPTLRMGMQTGRSAFLIGRKASARHSHAKRGSENERTSLRWVNQYIHFQKSPYSYSVLLHAKIMPDKT